MYSPKRLRSKTRHEPVCLDDEEVYSLEPNSPANHSLNDEVEEKLEQLHFENQKLVEKIRFYESEMEDLSDKYDKLESDLSKLNNKNQHFITENISLQSKLKAAERNLATLSQEFELETGSLKKEVATMKRLNEQLVRYQSSSIVEDNVTNKIKRNLHNYEEDKQVLLNDGWITDSIIDSYIQYLTFSDQLFQNTSLLFIDCSVSFQILSLTDPDTTATYLDNLNFKQKKYVFFIVNDFTPVDNVCDNMTRGTHWSLLVFENKSKSFYHFDSLTNYNYDVCKKIVNNVNVYLCGRCRVKNYPTPVQTNNYDCGVELICNLYQIVEYVSSHNTCVDLCLIRNNCYDMRRNLLHVLFNRKVRGNDCSTETVNVDYVDCCSQTSGGGGVSVDESSVSGPPRINSLSVASRVLLLSDSHGRGISRQLKDRLGSSHQVISYVHPNGKLSQVLQQLDQHCTSFNKQDFVIVLAGTNDISKLSPYQMTLRKGFNSMTSVLQKTNFIFCSIPYRFDCFNLFSDIDLANFILFDGFKRRQDKSNVVWLNINDIDRSCYTRHGLHFNTKGKTLLSQCLVSVIKNKVNLFTGRLNVTSTSSLQSFLHDCDDEPDVDTPESSFMSCSSFITIDELSVMSDCDPVPSPTINNTSSFLSQRVINSRAT